MHYNNYENYYTPSPDEKSLRLISIHKASKIFGIRYQSLQKMIVTGKLKYIRIGKRKKIPYINLVKFIEEQSGVQNPYNDNMLSTEEVSKRIDELIAEYREME